MPQWAVMQLHRMCSAVGAWGYILEKKHGVCIVFPTTLCWGAGDRPSALASLNVLHETHTTGVELIED